jgi:hypothetical protein
MAHPKSKRHHLLSILAFNIFGIVLSVGLLQCGGGDDEKTAICSPANVVVSGGDSIVYVYDNSNRLAEIQTMDGNTVAERYVMTYTDGKLTACAHKFFQGSSPDLTVGTFKFTYGSNGKPATRTFETGSGPVFEIVLYSYDEKGRLVNRQVTVSGNTMMSTRYEYSGDNVSKIYYVQTIGGDEILGAELLTLDNHKRFFAGSADLTLVETYVFNYEPSVNNVLTMKLYATPGTTYGAPFSYTFQVGYNEQGLVKSIGSSSGYPFPIFTFFQMSYTCR